MRGAPSGNRLAVALAPTPLVDDDYMSRRVHVVDADTGAVVAKFDNPGKLGDVAWSPDGRFVAMVSAQDVNDPAPGRLLVGPAAGGALKDVLPGYLGHVGAIAFRDADTIAFVGDEGVETVLGEVDVDGSKRRTVVAAGGPILSAMDVSKDGKAAAFVADTPTHPGEVFLMAGADRAPARLTDSNPWLAKVRLSKQEVVKFKARDGLDLEGILVRPLDEQPGKRYPLILTVHGGPEAHDRNGWRTRYSDAGQFGAARGYAVFYPNYRGSTGRGVAFSKLGQKDAAGKEFDDLVDAVDHLVSIGLADPKKVGITGGSYGGYASAWGATYYSERFAASVMFVGISNNVSRVGTTDIPNEEFHVHALEKPWENWDGKLKRSPIYYGDRHRTPLLIMHGTADPRVSPTQSARTVSAPQAAQPGPGPAGLVSRRTARQPPRRVSARLQPADDAVVRSLPAGPGRPAAPHGPRLRRAGREEGGRARRRGEVAGARARVLACPASFRPRRHADRRQRLRRQAVDRLGPRPGLAGRHADPSRIRPGSASRAGARPAPRASWRCSGSPSRSRFPSRRCCR